MSESKANSTCPGFPRCPQVTDGDGKFPRAARGLDQRWREERGYVATALNVEKAANRSGDTREELQVLTLGGDESGATLMPMLRFTSTAVPKLMLIALLMTMTMRWMISPRLHCETFFPRRNIESMQLFTRKKLASSASSCASSLLHSLNSSFLHHPSFSQAHHAEHHSLVTAPIVVLGGRVLFREHISPAPPSSPFFSPRAEPDQPSAVTADTNKVLS